MNPTYSAVGLASLLLHAKNAVSEKAHASNLKLERLCLALGAAQDKLSLRQKLSRADSKTLVKALDDWENEGGR